MDKLELVKLTFLKYETRLIRYALLFVSKDEAHGIVSSIFRAFWHASGQMTENDVPVWLFSQVRIEARSIAQSKTTATHSDVSMNLVSRVLLTFPLDQREVLKLKIQEGFAIHEVALITGHPEEHILVLLHNGLRAFRRTLKQEGLLESADD